MRRLVATGLACALTLGSAGQSEAGRNRGAFDHQAWRVEIIERGLDPDEVVYPFAASAEMVVWAESAVGSGAPGPVETLQRLQSALFEADAFDFEYDDIRTLTAEEAFSLRKGNCISFTALFIALSRAVGVPTRLMSVTRSPRVERDDGLVVINRHVAAALPSGRDVLIFDFNLSSEAELVSQRFIDDVHASAMFHNNLGATALRNGDLADALGHFQVTTGLWPQWAAGWVNSGVTMSRLGDLSGALRAYNRALEIDPGNSSALNNMAHAYLKLGREAEAEIARRAAVRSTENPFTLIAMADSELVRGNSNQAARLLRRARRTFPREPEVYVGLARLAARQGDTRRAEKQLRRADKLRIATLDPP